MSYNVCPQNIDMTVFMFVKKTAKSFVSKPQASLKTWNRFTEKS